MNGQDGRLDSESTYSWDSRFVFRQNVQRYSTLMPSFQIKYWGSVINLFKQKVQWIDEKKSWKLKAGALFLSAPYWKSVALKSPCKKYTGLIAMRDEIQLPESGIGLGLQWSPPPPGPSMVLQMQNQRWSDRAHLLQNILRALLKILQEPHYTDCTESPSMSPFLSFSALFMIHTTIYNTQKKWISIRSQVGERRKTASVAEMALWLPSDFTSQINN
jgi:hypothetical protein